MQTSLRLLASLLLTANVDAYVIHAPAIRTRVGPIRLSMGPESAADVSAAPDVTLAAEDIKALLAEEETKSAPKVAKTQETVDLTIAKEEALRLTGSLGGLGLAVGQAVGDLALTTGVEVVKVGAPAAVKVVGAAIAALLRAVFLVVSDTVVQAPPYSKVELDTLKQSNAKAKQESSKPVTESPSLFTSSMTHIDRAAKEFVSAKGFELKAEIERRIVDSPRWMWGILMAKKAEAEDQARVAKVMAAVEEAKQAAATQAQYASLYEAAAAETMAKRAKIESLKAKLAAEKKWMPWF